MTKLFQAKFLILLFSFFLPFDIFARDSERYVEIRGKNQKQATEKARQNCGGYPPEFIKKTQDKFTFQCREKPNYLKSVAEKNNKNKPKVKESNILQKAFKINEVGKCTNTTPGFEKGYFSFEPDNFLIREKLNQICEKNFSTILENYFVKTNTKQRYCKNYNPKFPNKWENTSYSARTNLEEITDDIIFNFTCKEINTIQIAEYEEKKKKLEAEKIKADKKRKRELAEKKRKAAVAEKKRQKEKAERERKKQQAIIDLESKKVTLGMGSGFWFNTDGYFATNHHVIEGCRTTQVKVNNELVNSKIISFDKINDLAIGKVEKNIDSVFSLSSKPELGEEVMVGGFPLSNILQNDSIKITRGIVSSLSGLNNNYSILQIDAPIQQGNSGGPIINSYGEVIGVATSYLRSTKEFDTQNVNFGVKVNLLRNMSESLGIKVSKAEKQKAKNSKQLAKVLEKNTIHVHCTNTLKEWVAFQNNQRSNASLSEHIKLNLKDYMK